METRTMKFRNADGVDTLYETIDGPIVIQKWVDQKQRVSLNLRLASTSTDGFAHFETLVSRWESEAKKAGLRPACGREEARQWIYQTGGWGVLHAK